MSLEHFVSGVKEGLKQDIAQFEKDTKKIKDIKDEMVEELADIDKKAAERDKKNEAKIVEDVGDTQVNKIRSLLVELEKTVKEYKKLGAPDDSIIDELYDTVNNLYTDYMGGMKESKTNERKEDIVIDELMKHVHTLWRKSMDENDLKRSQVLVSVLKLLDNFLLTESKINENANIDGIIAAIVKDLAEDAKAGETITNDIVFDAVSDSDISDYACDAVIAGLTAAGVKVVGYAAEDFEEGEEVEGMEEHKKRD